MRARPVSTDAGAPAEAHETRAGAFLSVRGLSRRFGERVAVDGISFEVRRGEAFGFLGPNGAGKTTLFHLLTGLLAPDAGEVWLDGAPAPPTDARMRRRL